MTLRLQLCNIFALLGMVVLVTSQDCGTGQKFDFTHIANGRDSARTQWSDSPILHVSGKENGPICGAALISNNFIATAAHCTRYPSFNIHEAYIILNEDLKQSRINLTQVYDHPNYLNSDFYNDISLLKLEREVNYGGSHNSPLCVINKPFDPNQMKWDGVNRNVLAQGPGVNETGTAGTLLEAKLKILSRSDCEDEIEKAKKNSPTYKSLLRKHVPDGLKDSLVCALPICTGNTCTAACSGDSGGPLLYNGVKEGTDKGKDQTLGGIHVGGRACGSVKEPLFWSSTAFHYHWMQCIQKHASGGATEDDVLKTCQYAVGCNSPEKPCDDCEAGHVCTPFKRCPYVNELNKKIKTATFLESIRLQGELAHLRCGKEDEASFCCQSPGPPSPSVKVDTSITNNYANTKVEVTLTNNRDVEESVNFTMSVPREALISKFLLEFKGETYGAKVMKTEEAERRFELNECVAGLLSSTSSSPNEDDDKQIVQFSLKLYPNETATFYLSYEEMVERIQGKYLYTFHLLPELIEIEDFSFTGRIQGTVPLLDTELKLKAPNDVDSTAQSIEPNFQDKKEYQMVFNIDGKAIQKKHQESNEAISIELSYDSQYPISNQVMQVADNIMIHSFRPDQLPTKPVHVLFLLDVSGSMSGNKLSQMKQAVGDIFEKMTDADSVTIVPFNTGTSVWDDAGVPYKIDQRGRSKALDYVQRLTAAGGTDIEKALKDTMSYAKSRGPTSQSALQLVFFLTDGQSNYKVNVDNIYAANTNNIPIYSIAFGKDADLPLLEKISGKNGIAIRIQESKINAGVGFEELEKFYDSIKHQKESLNVIYKVNDESVSTSLITDLRPIGGTEYRWQVTLNQTITKVKVTITNNNDVDQTANFYAEYVNTEKKFLQRQKAYLKIKSLTKGTDEEKKEAVIEAIEQQFVIDGTSMIVEAKNSYLIREQALNPKDRTKIDSNSEQCVEVDGLPPAANAEKAVDLDICINNYICNGADCPGLPKTCLCEFSGNSCNCPECEPLPTGYCSKGKHVTLDCAAAYNSTSNFNQPDFPEDEKYLCMVEAIYNIYC